MITDAFYIVLNMSLLASLVIVVVLLIQKIFETVLSKKLRFLLWAFVLVRLLVPIALPSSFSIVHLFEDNMVRSVQVIGEEEDKSLANFSNFVQQADEYQPLNYKNDHIEDLFKVLGFIWFIGMLAMVVFMLLSKIYLFRKLALKDAVDKTQDHILIYRSSYVKTPIMTGILKPKIILPDGIEQVAMDLILLHESAHVKRKDNVWKAFYGLSLCIHWFNPFVWYMIGNLYEDIELACDEAVMNQLDKDQIKEYAMALVEANVSMQGMPTAFSTTKLETRIKGIIKYKKMTKRMSILLFVIYMICGYVLLTNA